ncbi:response regulator [Thermoproteota archaeon]
MLFCSRVMLAKHGFKIDIAETGNDAMRMKNSNIYDLVILDYYLPDTTGDHVAIQIREFDKDIYIIGNSCAWDKDKARYCGLNDHTRRELDACIEKYLNSKKQR